MDFRLLGPLEVTEPGRTHSLGGVKQRSSLAILLLHAGEVVVSRGVHAGDEAPAPSLLVRLGAAQAGVAPDDARTLFRWSLTAAGS